MSDTATPKPEDELRDKLTDLYGTIALGGSPFNTDKQNEQIREDAWQEILVVIRAHDQAQLDRLLALPEMQDETLLHDNSSQVHGTIRDNLRAELRTAIKAVYGRGEQHQELKQRLGGEQQS